MRRSGTGLRRAVAGLAMVRFVEAARRHVHTLGRVPARVMAMLAVVVAVASVVATDARAMTAGQLTGVFRSLSRFGWVAADGGYSIPLSDGRTAWVFGDTIVPGGSATSPRLLPNSMVVTGAGPARVYLSPIPSPRDGSFFYWPADGRVARGSQIWLLCLRTRSDSSGLHILGNFLARLDVNGGRLISLRAVPNGAAVQWGSDLFDYRGYTYIYGTEPMSSASAAYWLHIARVPAGRLDTSWRYFTGKGWSANPAASARVFSRVSFSPALVNLGRSGLVLISQDIYFARTMYAWRAASPTGPFTRKRAVGAIPFVDRRTFSYLVHPHQEHSTGAATMFSFSTNTFEVLPPADLIAVYQPRFFTLSNRVLLGASRAQR